MSEVKRGIRSMARVDIWLIAIVLLGAILRFGDLDERSVHGDEMNMARFVTGERDIELNFGNAHLYLFILRIVANFSLSDYAMRFPAAVAGTMTVFLIYYTGRIMVDRRVGLLAALLLALSPIHIDLSQMIHCYALFCFLSLLSFHFLCLADRHSSAKYYLASAVVNGININVHLYTVFVIGAEVAVLVTLWLYRSWPWRWPTPSSLGSFLRRQRWGMIVSAVAVVLVLSSSVIVETLTPKLTELGKVTLGMETKAKHFRQHVRFRWDRRSYDKALRELTAWQSRDRTTARGIYGFAVVALALLIIKDRALGLRAAAYLFSPILPISLFTYLTSIDFGTRRLIFLLPIYLIVIGGGIIYLSDVVKKILLKNLAPHRALFLDAGVGLTVTALFFAPATKDYVVHYERPDFIFAARFLSRHATPNDFVLSWKPAQLYYYLPKTIPVREVSWQRLDQIQSHYENSDRIWYLRYGAVRHFENYTAIEDWLKEIGALDIPIGGGLFLSFQRRNPKSTEEMLEERVALLDDAIRLKPDRWYLHSVRSRLYAAQKRQAEAAREAELAKALRLR